MHVSYSEKLDRVDPLWPNRIDPKRLLNTVVLKIVRTAERPRLVTKVNKLNGRAVNDESAINAKLPPQAARPTSFPAHVAAVVLCKCG